MSLLGQIHDYSKIFPSGWQVDSEGQLFQGDIQIRSQSDPPYLPRALDDFGNKLYYTIWEIAYNMDAARHNAQTDFTSSELLNLINTGHDLDIYPAGGGPRHGSSAYYGRIYRTNDEMGAGLSDYWQAAAYANQVQTLLSQSPGGVRESSIPTAAEPPVPLSPEDYTLVNTPLGAQFIPTSEIAPILLAPTGSVDMVGVPDGTIIPSVGGPAILPHPDDVISPISPSYPAPGGAIGAVAGAPASTFPAWGYLALGAALIFLLGKSGR